MGLIPVLFPSFFPASGPDGSNARALWLELMAATQVAIGIGYLIVLQVVPLTLRLVSSLRAGVAEGLSLPERSVAGR